LFVAVGGSPGGLNPILTSPDGEKWTVRESPTRRQLWSATYGHGTFVAVGLGGTIVTSNDGIQWFDRSVGFLTRLFEVSYGNGYFVAVGEKGTILTSRDGVDWTNRNSGTFEVLSGVGFGNGRFIALGGGTILQSGLVDPPFHLSSPRVLTTGTFSCLVDAEPGGLLVVQVSPDLIHWMTLTNLNVTNRSTVISDADANEDAARFYRISSDPNGLVLHSDN
jgi:hypothetical protein